MDESTRIVERLLARVQPVAGWACVMEGWHNLRFFLGNLNSIINPTAALAVYAHISGVISCFR